MGLMRINEVMCTKCFAQCLAHSKGSINDSYSIIFHCSPREFDLLLQIFAVSLGLNALLPFCPFKMLFTLPVNFIF